MKNLIFFFLLCASSLIGAETPQAAFKRLQAGNKRFVDEKLLHPDRTHERRESLTESQSPFAVIVTCSDSRVVPEVIFDEGLGDLFVIRVAGNVIGSTELESVQYAVDHLNPSIVVVMGHERCGAVDAVVQGDIEDFPAIAKYIEPSVKKARKGNAKDVLKRSIELNALNMRAQLFQSPIVMKHVRSGSIDIVGAYYNLQSGYVQFLNAH